MDDPFVFAGELYRQAETPEDRRLAARVWLTDALMAAIRNGQDVAPAMALLGALEGLDFGHVDPMLKLPKVRGKGRVAKAPAEEGYQALALAAIECLWSNQGKPKGKLKLIIGSVEDTMAIKAGTLGKLREQFTGDFSSERGRLSEMSDAEIIAELKRVAILVGKAPRKRILEG